MCRYCAEHGDGQKWYLNPKNFTEEIIKSNRVQIARIVEMLGKNQHLNESGRKKIARIIEKMNRKKPSQFLESSETKRSSLAKAK